jgi:hypothetical protein
MIYSQLNQQKETKLKEKNEKKNGDNNSDSDSDSNSNSDNNDDNDDNDNNNDECDVDTPIIPLSLFYSVISFDGLKLIMKYNCVTRKTIIIHKTHETLEALAMRGTFPTSTQKKLFGLFSSKDSANNLRISLLSWNLRMF